MRVAEGKEDCLVLDFAGNVANHGPITAVEPNRKGGGGKPTKTCPECDEIMGAASKTCPHCGHEYPEKEREEKDPNWALGDEDIMGAGRKQRRLRGWVWRRHISKASGKEMVKVSYYGENLSDQAVTEYLPVLHDGYARDKAWSLLTQIAERSGAYLGAIHDLDDLCVEMNGSKPPQRIEFVKSGKFFEVKRRIWDADMEELAVAS